MLRAVDPQGQPTVIRACTSGRAPVQFDVVRGITQRKPIRGRPGGGIVQDPDPQLVIAGRVAEFHLEHVCGCAAKTLEDEMRIAARHGDRIRVEVEARPVTRLGIGIVVGKVDRVGIVDHGLQAIRAFQRVEERLSILPEPKQQTEACAERSRSDEVVKVQDQIRLCQLIGRLETPELCFEERLNIACKLRFLLTTIREHAPPDLQKKLEDLW